MIFRAPGNEAIPDTDDKQFALAYMIHDALLATGPFCTALLEDWTIKRSSCISQTRLALHKTLTLTKARHWWFMNPCCNQGALTLWQPDQTPVPFCMVWNGLGLYHLLCDRLHFLCRREPLVRRLCCHSKNCGAAGETPPGNRREGAQ